MLCARLQKGRQASCRFRYIGQQIRASHKKTLFFFFLKRKILLLSLQTLFETYQSKFHGGRNRVDGRAEQVASSAPRSVSWPAAGQSAHGQSSCTCSEPRIENGRSGSISSGSKTVAALAKSMRDPRHYLVPCRILQFFFGPEECYRVSPRLYKSSDKKKMGQLQMTEDSS